MQLTLFEREVSKESPAWPAAQQHRQSAGQRARRVRCRVHRLPAGLSVLTESWLREADFHFSPTKPDYGPPAFVEVFRRFKGPIPRWLRREHRCVLEHEGRPSPVDEDFTLVARQPRQSLFSQPVPRTKRPAVLQLSGCGAVLRRQIPRPAGTAIKLSPEELLARLAASNAPAHALRVDQRPALAALFPDHRLRRRFHQKSATHSALAPWNK